MSQFKLVHFMNDRRAAAIMIAMAAGASSANCLFAQQGGGPTTESFDAVSIKKNSSGRNGGGWRTSPGRLMIENQTILDVVESAFNLKGFQVKGAPAWLKDEKYDITAVTASGARWRQLMEMLKPVLKERMAFAYRSESVEVPGYVLRVGSKGPKFHAYQEMPGDNVLKTGETQHMGDIQGRRITMGHLADFLTNSLQTPIADQTNLRGEYEISLTFAAGLPIQSTDSEMPPMSLPMALQNQLGLTLAPWKTPVTVLVIDHVERPSED